jgi:hypothetical protein
MDSVQGGVGYAPVEICLQRCDVDELVLWRAMRVGTGQDGSRSGADNYSSDYYKPRNRHSLSSVSNRLGRHEQCLG